MTAQLHAAAQAGDLAQTQAELAAGASPNWADENGETPLMAAARNGHLEVVQALLAAGADVHARDANDWTALFKACHNPELDAGFAPVVQALVDAGADVNARIFYGITPLMLAAGGGEGAVCEVLLNAGAEAKAANDGGRTALAMAKERYFVDVINLLHEAEGFVPETEGSCSSTGRRGPSDAQVVSFIKRPMH
ncbi:MAG TPA: ankyrin repeat domain-containing protein [Thiobacillaceae bacterium]|nr:ankyrin repeat domain-containing protein [Thiobacillaceae bacterium]